MRTRLAVPKPCRVGLVLAAGADMNVERIMCSDAKTCRADGSLNDAARIMWEHDCGFVPVVDDIGRVVSVITDRDICMAAYTQGARLEEIPVSRAASHGAITVLPGESIERAEALMRRHRVRRLPVVNEAGGCVGVLSMNDLARNLHLARAHSGALRPESVAQTLAAISTPRGEETPAISSREPL